MNLRITLAMMLFTTIPAALPGCDPADFGGAPSNRDSKVEQELFQLARMNGCIECHTVSVGKFGPSWNDIAERYQGAPTEQAREVLIDSVENGSKGKYFTWKTSDGMPPLKRRVSHEHVERLVDYILALRE